eukprot:TRINITY_DN7214_c0_g1_i1.p1 TRINITY_DN7214_c0_g1~~TRINITY_DN7214_c0_g1_i1.p1  ORF type:complete len:435 (+),score=129.10 TRINITY_DN7214_c0_g1_i1:105-1307(+)
MAIEEEEINEKAPLLKDEVSTQIVDESGDNAHKQRMLAITFGLMIVVGLGNKVLGKLQTLPMNNYPYFQSVYTTFVYIPLSFVYIIPMIFWGNQISREQRDIPWYKFAVMGVLDGIAGIMQSFATNYIPSGPLVILVLQSAIPVSMILSKFLLKSKYEWQHYVGALIVVIGLVIVIVFPLVEKNPAPPSDDGTQQSPPISNVMILVWCLVLIASCVPMTLSSVYKEKALGETEIDVVYLNGWVAVWQFLTLLPLAVPAGYANNLTPGEIPSNFWNGVRCYFGVNSITGKNADHCEYGPLFVNLYILFNVAYNILIIMILKYGSANLLWVAMTIIVPLSNITFALPIPGHVDFQFYTIIGLVVIMAGLIIFRFWGKLWETLRFLFRYLRGQIDSENPSIQS